MTDPETIITKTYRLTPATYFRIAAGAKLPTLLATAILIAIASTAAAIVIDLRIILVALIILMLVLPFVIAHIFYSKLLTKDAGYALMPKKVVIIPGKSVCEIYSPQTEEESQEKNRTITDRLFGWEGLRSVRKTANNLILTFTNSEYNLVIPLESLLESDIKKICEIGGIVKNY